MDVNVCIFKHYTTTYIYLPPLRIVTKDALPGMKHKILNPLSLNAQALPNINPENRNAALAEMG